MLKHKLFDSHTHIGHSRFDKDRDEVINKCFDVGIGIIEVGNDAKSSQNAIELVKKYSGKIWATVGCHPHYIDEFNLDFYKKLAQEKEVVAIGECGLDYSQINIGIDADKRRLNISKNQRSNQHKSALWKQKEIFIKHIELAKEVNKPLMIHCREAFFDLIKILKSNTQNLKPSILHFFTGSMEDAKQLLKMGFYFTFNGLITFNYDFNEIIRSIPLEKILLETDAPYVAPIPYKGQRNEPSYIVEIAKKMAEIKNVSLEEICTQTTINAKKVFNI